MKRSNSDFRLLAGLFPAMLFAAGTTAWSADVPVALKDAFKDHFVVGTAVNRSMVTGGTGFRRSAEQNAADVALLKKHFNQITAENDTKGQLIHPREGADGYDFGQTDALVNFGQSNHMQVLGHTLVWHSQTPNWVFAGTMDLGGASLTTSGQGEVFLARFDGPPLLAVTRAATQVILSWPAAAAGFQLQGAGTLPAGNEWQNVPEIPVVIGDRNFVTNIFTSSNAFFRLRKL